MIRAIIVVKNILMKKMANKIIQYFHQKEDFKLNSVVFINDCVLSWQSKGLSNESIMPPATSNNSLNPK